MKTSPALAFVVVAVFTSLWPACAEDYQGADAILKQVEAQLSATGTASRKPSPLQQWRDDLKSFQGRVPTLAPEEAARAWLELFERASKLPVGGPASVIEAYGNPVAEHLIEAFGVLPPPEDWNALAAQVAARPLPGAGSADFSTPILRIISGTLQNSPDSVRQAIEGLQEQVNGLDQAGEIQLVQSLRETFLALSGDKQGALKNFEAKLALLKTGGGSSSDDENATLNNSLEVPNLVDLAGETHAAALLRKVFGLHLPGLSIADARTKALARKVALETGDALKFAPWSLVDTLDSTALYETLAKHFPRNAQQQSDSDYRAATDYYLLGLIVAGRSDAAIDVAEATGKYYAHEQQDALKALPEEALGDLAEKGYAQEVYQFFDRLLAAHPDLPYWHGYIAAAVLAGKTDDMLSSVKAASERADLKPHAHNELLQAYGDALLAADRVAEALPILRECAAAMRIAATEDGAKESDLQKWAQSAAVLAGVGQLVGDKGLLNEQLDALISAGKTQAGVLTSTEGASSDSVEELFLTAGRGPELERVYADSLLQFERVAAERPMPAAVESSGLYEQTRSILYALTSLYYRAGRYEDIVALLNQAKYWGAEDVADLLETRWGSSVPDFGYQAARALQKTGDAAAALRLVNAYLSGHGGSDPAYALLLELMPPAQAEARLNELFLSDQFEERPLIWRAVLQLGQRRLDEAEKSARQAISIDPSDGEEGRGDRMRAYAVLGDILEHKGEAEKAAQMRQAVQAIRLSEDADRFHGAGLLTRAVGMYEKALDYFSDAYCIQSRLAIQLTALGKLDEAMIHYEHAYELMPVSFGRMESHCFGCERAFAGEKQQSTAERVFQKFVQQQPDNPRVHYLLGYLRSEEDRNAEAASEFRAAVKLDPDYINAWKQLASSTDDPQVHGEAELNLLRLDPQNKHGDTELDTIVDLRALWAAAVTAAKIAPPVPANIYPLEASKAELEKQRQPGPRKPAEDAIAAYRESESLRRSPQAVIAGNKVIAEALQFLAAGSAVPSM